MKLNQIFSLKVEMHKEGENSCSQGSCKVKPQLWVHGLWKELP